MLTEEYNNLMKDGLRPFAENLSKSGDVTTIEYNLFYPTIGKDFEQSHELVVYGQAVNGWDGENKWKTDEIPSKTAEIFKKCFEYSQEDNGKCPLEWINEDWAKYKLFRSFFWNVTYKLVKAKYGRTDENWNNIIAWSNVTKIAPANHANPNLSEIDAQLEYSAKLFVKELDDLQPNNVLLITNLRTWAAPIFKRANITYETHTESLYIQATASYGNTRIVVTKRPYVGAHQPFVEEVMKYMTQT